MVDVAWSEKREALIPGSYKDGMFIPLNGDDPIPQEMVLASRPPKTVRAIDENGELRDIRPIEALRAAHSREISRFKAVAPWSVGIFLVCLAFVILAGQPDDDTEAAPSLAVAPVIANDMDLSAGLPRLEGMTAQLLDSVGDKSGLDCSTDEKLLASLQTVHKRVFSRSAILQRGIQSVEIEGGTAKLVGFRGAHQPGDKNLIESNQDFYLVSPACSAIPFNPIHKNPDINRTREFDAFACGLLNH